MSEDSDSGKIIARIEQKLEDLTGVLSNIKEDFKTVFSRLDEESKSNTTLKTKNEEIFRILEDHSDQVKDIIKAIGKFREFKVEILSAIKTTRFWFGLISVVLTIAISVMYIAKFFK